MLKNEFKGWTKLELLWMVLASSIIVALSVYWKDSTMAIISALTGVLCVICTGKGKLSAYVFGLINCVLYAIIAYQSKFYMETVLNALYYVPLQFYGFYTWSKNMNPETNEVYKKRMTNNQRFIMYIVVILGTILLGYISNLWGGNLPFIDALSTITSVVAMIVSIKMFMEQWILWVIIDVITVGMYLWAFINGECGISVLLMWIVYLTNAIIMYFKWRNEAYKKGVSYV